MHYEPSDHNPVHLKALIRELTITLQILQHKPIMTVIPKTKSVKLLRARVTTLADTIYNLTDDISLKATVGSTFDTMPAEDITAELQAWNAGERHRWE